MEIKLKFFFNAILQANIRSQSAKEICRDAVYIDKVGKSITRPVSEVEKSFLGQHGVEFQVKMIGNIKIGQNNEIAHTMRIILIIILESYSFCL